MDLQEDYRKFIINRWIEASIQSFRELSTQDYERLDLYYERIISRFIKDNLEASILELGPGYGPFIYSLKKRGYNRITAVELIPHLCEYLQDRFDIKVYNSDIISYFMNNSPINTFDFIFAFDVIEHFSKPEILYILENVFKALKSSGAFVMRVPNAGSLAGLYIRYSGFTHETAFTDLSVNEIFRVVGFSAVYVVSEEDFFSINPMKKLIKKVGWKILSKFLGVNPYFLTSANIIGVGYK